MSLKQTKQNLSDALNDLQKVIEQLAEDLERLEAVPGKEKFAHFKKGQIKSLLNVNAAIEAHTEEFNGQYQNLFKQNKELRQEINKHEVTALIHGIYDVKQYTCRPYDCLLSELHYLHSEKLLQMPVGLLFAANTEKLALAFPPIPNFTLDKKGNKVFEEKPKKEHKTVSKPVLSFKDFNPTQQLHNGKK